MSKEQLLADAKAELSAKRDSVESEVLAALIDKAQAEVVPADGGPSEAEIQARIDAGKAEQKALDDQALVDALAADEVLDQAKIDELNGLISALQTEMAAKQVEHDALALKEGVEASQLAAIKSSQAQIQAVADYLGSLLVPAPVPVEPQA